MTASENGMMDNRPTQTEAQAVGQSQSLELKCFESFIVTLTMNVGHVKHNDRNQSLTSDGVCCLLYCV